MKHAHSLCTVILIGLLTVLSGCSQKEPEFNLLNDGSVTFSGFEGKVVLINYWAVWCKPCREEIPALNQFQKNYANDVVVLGVNFDGVSGDKLKQQVRELGIEFDTLLDDPKPFFGIASSGVLPETIVIDRRGQFHQVLLGPQTGNDLEMLLSSLVENINYSGSL